MSTNYGFGHYVDYQAGEAYPIIDSDGRISGICDGDSCESTFDIWSSDSADSDDEPDYFALTDEPDYFDEVESDEPLLYQDEYEDLDHTF